MDLGAITSNQIIGSLLSPRTFGAVPALDRLGPSATDDARATGGETAEGPEALGRTRRPDRFERSAPTGFSPAASAASGSPGAPGAPSGSGGPDATLAPPPPNARRTPAIDLAIDLAGGLADAPSDAADRAGPALPSDPENAPETGDDAALEGGPVGPDGEPLDASEKKQVEELKARDREVRTHEQAHKAAGGQYTGAISYSYQTGPDGQRYAVGGSVSIDASPVPGDPEATIAKMQVVRRAALAPAEPSSQDQRVASQASRTEAEARAELARPSDDGEGGGPSRGPSQDGPDDAANPVDRGPGAASDRLDPGATSRPDAAPAFADRRARATYATAS